MKIWSELIPQHFKNMKSKKTKIKTDELSKVGNFLCVSPYFLNGIMLQIDCEQARVLSQFLHLRNN